MAAASRLRVLRGRTLIGESLSQRAGTTTLLPSAWAACDSPPGRARQRERGGLPTAWGGENKLAPHFVPSHRVGRRVFRLLLCPPLLALASRSRPPRRGPRASWCRRAAGSRRRREAAAA